MWTGIPVTSISGDESERLLKMEEHLHSRIVGQHEVTSVLPVREARNARGN